MADFYIAACATGRASRRVRPWLAGRLASRPAGSTMPAAARAAVANCTCAPASSAPLRDVSGAEVVASARCFRMSSRTRRWEVVCIASNASAAASMALAACTDAWGRRAISPRACSRSKRGPHTRHISSSCSSGMSDSKSAAMCLTCRARWCTGWCVGDMASIPLESATVKPPAMALQALAHLLLLCCLQTVIEVAHGLDDFGPGRLHRPGFLVEQ